MDSKAISLAQKKNKKYLYTDTFSPNIPQHFTTGRTAHRIGPPIISPHLLQIILNKNLPLSCQPILLPEPNHVMLNHLYTQSIEDGVIVLGSIQRYKRKYVTTLMYKPISEEETNL